MGLGLRSTPQRTIWAHVIGELGSWGLDSGPNNAAAPPLTYPRSVIISNVTITRATT